MIIYLIFFQLKLAARTTNSTGWKVKGTRWNPPAGWFRWTSSARAAAEEPSPGSVSVVGPAGLWHACLRDKLRQKPGICWRQEAELEGFKAPLLLLRHCAAARRRRRRAGPRETTPTPIKYGPPFNKLLSFQLFLLLLQPQKLKKLSRNKIKSEISCN